MLSKDPPPPWNELPPQFIGNTTRIEKPGDSEKAGENSPTGTTVMKPVTTRMVCTKSYTDQEHRPKEQSSSNRAQSHPSCTESRQPPAVVGSLGLSVWEYNHGP